MICPDVNLLLFSAYPQHQAAKAWWDGVLSTTQPVRIGHVVILGYIRISTHARMFSTPLTIQQALDVVDGWLGQPNVELIAPTAGHWVNLRAMLEAGGTGGNLTTDAHLAALASEYGLVIYSNDADLSRFPGIKCVNPL